MTSQSVNSYALLAHYVSVHEVFVFVTQDQIAISEAVGNHKTKLPCQLDQTSTKGDSPVVSVTTPH
jgi:hypothetical protein